MEERQAYKRNIYKKIKGAKKKKCGFLEVP